MKTEANGQIDKNANAELDRMKEICATMEKVANIGSWDWDFITNHRWFSDQFYIICGFEPGDPTFKADTVEQLIHPDDYKESVGAVKLAMENKLPYLIEKRLLLQDGTIKHVIAQGRVFYENQQPVRMIGVMQDVTDQKEAEQELKERERNLQDRKDFMESILESMTDGFAITDNQGVFLDVNQKLCDLTGFSKEEYIGSKPPHPDWPEEEYGRFFKSIQQAFKGNLEQVELIYKKKTGERFPVTVTPSVIRNQSGEITNFYGMVKDITLQKKVEEKLRESEAKNRAIIKALPDMIFIVSEEGEYLDIYAPNSKGLVAKPEELLGRNFKDYLGPGLSQTLLQSFTLARATGEAQIVEYPISLDNGTSYFEARIVAYEQNSFLSIVRDITQRTEAESALKLEKETTQTYLDIAEVIFVLINRDQTIQMINKRGCEILEYEEQELIGKNWFDTAIREEARDEVKQGFIDVILEKRKVRRQVEHTVITKSGKELIMAWSNTIIRDNAGLPVATLSSGSDLTAIKMAELETESAVIKGQELERKRIAEDLHDGVGSLLSAIKLNFDHLAGQLNEDEEQRTLSGRLNDLLIKAMDEIRSISHNLKPSTIEAFGLVNTLEDLCRDISNTQSVKVNFQSFGFKQRMDYILEIGLYRVAQELINNAVKHAQTDRIDVKLIEHERYALLMVEDNGVGFDPDRRSGLGMGLKNVANRVRSMQGTFDIDTISGRGSLITVEIPKQPAHE